MAEFKPKIWKKQDTVLVNLPYRDFDPVSSEHYKAMVANLINSYKFCSLIVDFSSIMLVDATGMAAIVHAHNLCSSQNIKIILTSVRDNIKSALESKGITSMIDIYDNIHDALDMAMSYAYTRQKELELAQSFENVFGESFEEKIDY